MEHELNALIEAICDLPDDARIDALNIIRARLHEISPFCDEPVDCIQWVRCETVTANDYNPNTVAAPEMRLLEESIRADGYTQPIVTHDDGKQRTVVDGFHRNRVGRETLDIRRRLQGYLPVVTIRAGREDLENRMASTIRHNRARGKHGVEAMTDIVLYLSRKNWSDARIAKELGMDSDEVLRFRQIGGLAEMFADQEFSEAWEIG